jgi:hypothetical protein
MATFYRLGPCGGSNPSIPLGGDVEEICSVELSRREDLFSFGLVLSNSRDFGGLLHTVPSPDKYVRYFGVYKVTLSKKYEWVENPVAGKLFDCLTFMLPKGTVHFEEEATVDDTSGLLLTKCKDMFDTCELVDPVVGLCLEMSEPSEPAKPSEIHFDPVPEWQPGVMNSMELVAASNHPSAALMGELLARAFVKRVPETVEDLPEGSRLFIFHCLDAMDMWPHARVEDILIARRSRLCMAPSSPSIPDF